MGKVGLIIGREYFTRVKKKSFVLMTVLVPILMVGLLVGAVFLTMQDSSVHKILVVDESTIVVPELESEPNMSYEESMLNLPSAIKEFRGNNDYTLVLWIPPDIYNTPKVTLYYKKLPSLKAQKYVSNEVEKIVERYKISKAGYDKDKFYDIKTNITVNTGDEANFESDKQLDDDKMLRGGIGFGFAVLIYIFIFLYGVQVMRGVIEEKTSRIVEVIISSVKPFQLMMGKIIGIALVGLTQFMLWVVIGIVSVTVLGMVMPDVFSPASQADLPQMASSIMEDANAQKELMAAQEAASSIMEKIFEINWGMLIGMFLFYFLGGYLMYASLFAAVGGAVDSEADTQQFMLPITIPLIMGFVVAEFAWQNPEGPAAFWFSMIPLTSPVVMMVRGSMGGFPAWELPLSMLLLAAGFLFTTWLAGRIYRTGILMYGKKVSWKELWKWLFYKG